MAGHYGRTRMLAHLRRTYYWPLMTADITSTVHYCPHCARNQLRLIYRKQPKCLFPAKQPLESIAVNLLGPLPKTKAGDRFILLMDDRVRKLTKAVLLKNNTGLDVAKAFGSHWAFNYGARKEVLSDIGLQFANMLCQNNLRTLEITKNVNSAYHPQKNGQVEHLYRSISVMLHCGHQ